MRVITDRVNFALVCQEKSVRVACCYLLDLMLDANSSWQVKYARAVRFVDAELADLIVATSFDCTVLMQKEGLVAATRDLNNMGLLL